MPAIKGSCWVELRVFTAIFVHGKEKGEAVREEEEDNNWRRRKRRAMGLGEEESDGIGEG
jgi:hypothetical protein